MKTGQITLAGLCKDLDGLASVKAPFRYCVVSSPMIDLLKQEVPEDAGRVETQIAGRVGCPFFGIGIQVFQKPDQQAAAWMFSDLSTLKAYLDGELLEKDLLYALQQQNTVRG